MKLVQCPTNIPCRHFYTLRFATRCCNIIADRKAFWSPLFASVEPPFICPLESPTYKICNATIDLPIFQRLFTTVDPNLLLPAVWNAKVQAYDEHQKEFVCLDLKLRYVRQDM
ncbi:hypothetical protein FOCC_FOCC002455 [Frankliniella occidentalis]|nr:hypothetical protein FOCC_FOCC002455 [Frankliniella occidentalis]